MQQTASSPRLTTNEGVEPPHWCPACQLPVQSVCVICGTPRPLTAPPEIWLEIPLVKGWLAAYRVVVDNGRLTFGELRIFPDETGTGRHDGGRWSAERLGTHAPVPRGGLPIDVVRKVTTKRHRSLLDKAFAKWQNQNLQLMQAVLNKQGLKRVIVLDEDQGGHGDLFYARMAKRYLQCCDSGSRPVSQLRDQLQSEGRKCATSTIAQYVTKARRRGLLTEPPSGRKGGELTPRARALLQQHGDGELGEPQTRH